MSNKFMLYEGKEPYIFVSYSHKDKKQVLPVLEHLFQNNYRVWYDQGIHPGSDWPEVVAERLQHSAVFLVFLSENYMKSQNCVREIHYAVAKEKKFLSIMLEDVQMTSGVEMQLCVSQAIVCNKFQRKERLYDELLHAKVLETCKMPTEKKEIVEVSEVKIEKKTKKRTNPMLAKCLAGLLTLSIVGFGLGSLLDGKKVEINGQEFNAKSTYVELEDMSLDSSDMDTLLEFPELTSLKFRNCVFDIESADKLGEFEEIYRLEMISCKGARDYSFLERYKDSLYSLVLDDMKLTNEDVSFSTVFEKLRTLQLTGNPELEDISKLKEIMPNLEEIILDNNNIADVSVLSEYETLISVSLKGNKIANIDNPMKSLRIGSINLSENPLVSINGIKDLTVLYNVQMENCLQNLKDNTGLECIAKSKDTIHEINLSGNDLEQNEIEQMIVDGMALRKLLLDDNKLTNLKFMSGLQPDISWFSAQNNEIVSVEGLNEMIELSFVDLSDNEIQEIEDLPAFLNESESEQTISLDLRNNKITSLKGLESSQKFWNLKLNGNELSKEDSQYLEKLKGYFLQMDYFEGMPLEMFAGFTTPYIKDVPLDQRVALEDGIPGCKFGFEDIEGNFVED